MKLMDSKFWEELTMGQSQNLPNTSEILLEDNEPDTHLEDVVADDSELPILILISAMTNDELPENVGVGDGGGLVSLAEAEDINVEPESEIASAEADNINNQPNLEKEQGLRRKFANKYCTISTECSCHASQAQMN